MMEDKFEYTCIRDESVYSIKHERLQETNARNWSMRTKIYIRKLQND